MKNKKYKIELNQKQLQLLNKVCEFYARLVCGQLWLGSTQELFLECWSKTHPKEKWQDIRDELEEDMKMLQKKYWNLPPNSSYGIHWNDNADIIWDMHKVCEHTLFLSRPKEEQERFKFTVMADTPMAFGNEELIRIEEITEV